MGGELNEFLSHNLFMRVRPNNLNKNLQRTKSPPVLTSQTGLISDNKHEEKHSGHPKHQGLRLGSADPKIRVASPNPPIREVRRLPEKQMLCRQQKSAVRDQSTRATKIEGIVKTSKDEDGDTTQQSSSQHLSYVTGEYQLDSYDLFSRRKNVKFQEKIEDIEKAGNKRGNSKNSSRNSSILKNSSRVLDRSLTSSQKSISIQNSFTAVRKCKIGLTGSTNDNGNSLVRKKYESILSQLRAGKQRGQGKQKYIDDMFPPVEASIFSTSVHRKGHISRTKDEIVWMRLSEIFPHKTQIFSRDKSSANMSIWRGQKSYAQSYLVCCMNAIKRCPQLLSFMFESQQMNLSGIYLVKIYQQNSWKYVIIDDLIPCVKKRGKAKQQDMYTPIFLNVTPSEGNPLYLWPYLLEKAYANYYSSYQNLCYGHAIDFLAQLTGSPYKQFSLVAKKNGKEAVDQHLSQIGTYLANDGVVGLAYNQEKGIYYPLYVLKEIYTAEDIKLGLGDPANSYNPVKIQLSQLCQSASMVYLCWFKQYANMTTCPVYPPKQIRDKLRKNVQKQYRVKFLQIPPNDTISLRSFTLFKKAKCCVDLRQKQNRFYWQCGISQYLWVRCLFLQKQYDGGYRWICGRYTNQKHIIFEQNLDAGQYILVIMVQWRQRHNKELTAVLYSDCDFLKFQRKNYQRQQRIIELACMDVAQRNGRLNQINKSICAYTYLCEETALVIQNIINQRTKGDVTIMRSINGLKSKVEIFPINKEFQVDAPQEYGALEKNQTRKVIGQSVEIDIAKGESFTVVLRMRGGVDRKFFRVFNFG